MPLKAEIVNVRKICSVLEKYKSKRKKWPMQIQPTVLGKKKEYHTDPGIAFGSKQTRIKFTTSIVYLRLFF